MVHTSQESASESDSVSGSDCNSNGFILLVLASNGGSPSSSSSSSSSSAKLDLLFSTCWDVCVSIAPLLLSRFVDLKISGLYRVGKKQCWLMINQC